MSDELKQMESAVAHDLNNYLQLVTGNLELLKRRNVFVPQVVEAALEATHHAAELADRLSAIGRLRTHAPRAVDLNRLLEELRDVVALTAGDAIRVELELEPALRKPYADPHVLHVVLLELATNARDAMKGGGRLAIRTANAPEGLVMLEVADTGAGMAPDALAHAFEPLAAGEGKKPAGLGLYIVEACIRRAGGRIELETAPGTGTRVKLFLRQAPRA